MQRQVEEDPDAKWSGEDFLLLRAQVDEYNRRTTGGCEGRTGKLRKKLVDDLRTRSTFHKRMVFLDKKIIYDQRFFSSNYDIMQLMVSDIRKQCRLNEEIIEMRKTLAREVSRVEQARLKK
jgi:hypothetical protein